MRCIHFVPTSCFKESDGIQCFILLACNCPVKTRSNHRHLSAVNMPWQVSCFREHGFD